MSVPISDLEAVSPKPEPSHHEDPPRQTEERVRVAAVEQQYDGWYESPIYDVHSPQFDFKAYVTKVDEILRAAGERPPGIRLAWHNLTVETPVVHRPQAQTIGDNLDKLFVRPLRFVRKLVYRTLHPNLHHEPLFQKSGREMDMFGVLDKVSGYAEQGDMVLLLAPPKAGTSTLLKVLSGKSQYRKTPEGGSVYYNGLDNQEQGKYSKKLEAVVKNWIRLVDQDDNHFARMTVRQTLQFAADCRSSPSIPFAERLKQNRIILIARVLGIEGVLDTKVGDENVRGISGGEKRRVTIAEQLVGGMGRIFLFDNLSTGLDSATALDIIRSIGKAAKFFGLVIVMSLQQPSIEMFNEFDTVGVLDSGSMLFYGPCSEAAAFFTGLGITRPPGRSVPDYLVTAAAPNAGAFESSSQGEMMSDNPSCEAASPTHNGFSLLKIRTAYEASAHYESVLKAVERHVAGAQWNLERYLREVPKPIRKSLEAQAPNPFWSQMRYLLRRARILKVTDPKSLIGSFLVPTVVAIIAGLLFLRIPLNSAGARTRSGILFIAIVYVGLGAVGTVEEKYKQRVVHLKQSGAGFYEPAAFVAANVLVDVMLELIKSLLFTLGVYFLAGLNLQSNGARLAYFFLALWGIAVALQAFVRMLSFAFASRDVAVAVMGMSVMLFVVFSGFLLVKSEIAGYFIWIYWISPFRYGFEGLAVNEYRGLRFSCEDDELVPPANASVLPKNVLVCPVDSGAAYARENLGLIVNGWIQWLDLGYLFFFGAVCLLLATYFLQGMKGHLHQHTESNKSTEEEGGRGRRLENGQHVAVDLSKNSEKHVRPATLAWKNLTYSVPISKNRGTKQLLKEVSGVATPGRVCALMGSSGAGKSTIMNVLCLRQGPGEVAGEVRVNGYDRNEYFHRIIGYCQQEDIHTAECTVRESIRFSADLRLPEDMPSQAKEERVDHCLETLDLLPVKDHLVGGLNAEARKRVTIGVEWVASPSILFLDEPTSGLDARAALTVMRAVRKVAKLGCGVVCTIHQPSSELFLKSFDDLLLLQRGGRTVYFGELGSEARTLVDYLERNGAEKIAQDRNPADWMLDVIGAGTAATSKNAIEWSHVWDNSPEKANIISKVDKALNPQGEDVSFEHKRATKLRTQFRILLRRARAVYWRRTEYNWTRIVLSVIQGLMLGIIFLLPERDQTGLATLFSALFLSLLPAGNQTANIVGPSLRNRPVLNREVASGLYSEKAYHAASSLVELPYILVSTGLFSCLFYFLVGFQTRKFGYFLLASVLINIYGVYTGEFLAYASPTGPIALMLAPIVQVFGNLFSGFLITRAAFPVYMEFILWINPFAYFLGGISKNEYSGADFTCDRNEALPFRLPTEEPYNYSSCTDIPGFPPTQITQFNGTFCAFCPVVRGDQLLDQFGVPDYSKWIDIAAIAGFCILIRICGYIALRRYVGRGKS